MNIALETMIMFQLKFYESKGHVLFNLQFLSK